ncbi:hypothetical protein B0H17DRAFT_1194067 [Mycena rosella]|uniref:Uncharacterized protein n=1 Tax=Mycena rosella TaxID=1033263 RepID=A0AAD7GRG0_MYCRO|nr:hypothetical protein B0H17DRAFT_1194067 [Mycena rosella]
MSTLQNDRGAEPHRIGLAWWSTHAGARKYQSLAITLGVGPPAVEPAERHIDYESERLRGCGVISTSTALSDSDDESITAILARCKRRIVELEFQLKKTQAPAKSAAQVKSYAALGRAICKVVSTFDSVDSLIAEDDRRRDLEEARMNGDEIHDAEDEPTPEQNRLHNGYKELCRYIVPLRKALAEANHEELAPILAALRSGARNARSDDTKNVREAIVPWLNILFPKMDPPLDPDSRDNRGLYHDDTGRLLCPIDYDWDDEEVRTAIREGDSEYPVTADSWFRGLYPPDGFDPEQPEVGLFKNVVLLKVFKFIFTSPLSVKTMPKDVDRENVRPGSTPLKKVSKKVGSMSKRNVAAIIGLKAVTGRSIGYAAVQYRVALSDANHWDESDGAFDYITFYNNIVEYFEFPPGPRARADVNRLLDFWNTNVFGTTPQWALYEGGSRATSSVALLRAARAGREVEV